MGVEVIFSRQARVDIERQLVWLFEHAGEPTAEKWLSDVLLACGALADTLLIGRVLVPNDGSTRIHPHSKAYTIVYQLKANELEVLRIYGRGQNVLELLNLDDEA